MKECRIGRERTKAKVPRRDRQCPPAKKGQHKESGGGGESKDIGCGCAGKGSHRVF